MALRTGGWKSGGNVIRIFRVVEVCLVTSNTIRWCALELSVGVTLIAGQRDVCTSKGEARHRGVIELGARPRRRAMALLTSGRES